MKHFRVLTGKHYQDGKEHAEGDVVSCTHDLTKIFPGKFRALEEDLKLANEAAATDTEKEVVLNIQNNVPDGYADVTGDFQIPADFPVKVFTKGKSAMLVDDSGAVLRSKIQLARVQQYLDTLAE